MPAARGMKRAASKSSAATASTGPKNKKKRGPIQLEIPSAPKKRGRVFTCGQGDVGQLGLGEDVVETTKFKYVTALGDKIVDAQAGGMHTIALDSTGKVWTFGCNDEGALGRNTSGEREEGAPGAVPLPGAAVAVAAGDSHSAALLDNGDIYAWGAFRDSHGSMGLVMRGREGKSCKEPIKLDLPEPAVDLASGGDHLVVLTTSGSVYTMGCGEQGQLGRLAQRSATRDARQGFSALLVPSKVTLKQGASRVWAGYHATFVLDANNDKVFAWGLNNYGQLGITGEKRKGALFAPTECDAWAGVRERGVRAVAAGQHHSLALDAAGQLYAVGRCDYGRLGLGERAGDAETLEPIPKLMNKKCVSISAGTSNSFAVTDSGEVLAWGMGSEGQLGTGTCSDAAEPAPALPAAFQGRLPLAVSAGGQHTVLLVEDPTSQKDPSPTPDLETEEEKIEDSEEKRDIEESKKEKPRGKRQKKEQEGEISSTSSSQVADVSNENKPEKVNGDDKKETPMEVDETDKTEEKKEETTPPTEQTETEPQQRVEEEPQPDAPSCDTDTNTDTDRPSDTSAGAEADPEPPHQHQVQDVDMEKPELNGTPDMDVVEAKTLDESIPPANPLTTTA